MKVLVIGSGAREHALAWKLRQSPRVEAIYAAPGNYGTGLLGTNIALAATDAEGLARWAASAGIDLTVVGPEAALAAGVVDRFTERGLRIFGPSQAAARIETSKAWAKAFMRRHGIPTAAYEVFTERDPAEAYLAGLGPDAWPIVVKADGLAGGKGVVVAPDRETAREAMLVALETPGSRVVLEQFLTGNELSLLAISDGATVRPLAPAHDYKRAYDGDTGPMTGGMGAYSPVPLVEDALVEEIMARIVEPTIRGMAAEGTPYSGILYAGLMLTPSGPQVLEFNARFGDPETQVVLPRWDDDLAVVLDHAARGALAELPAFRWSALSACGVVLAAAGYPEEPRRGQPIEGLSAGAGTLERRVQQSTPDVPVPADDGPLIFCGGVTAGPDGTPVTSGGRVLTVVGRGMTADVARAAAYAAADTVRFPGAWRRSDIGAL